MSLKANISLATVQITYTRKSHAKLAPKKLQVAIERLSKINNIPLHTVALHCTQEMQMKAGSTRRRRPNEMVGERGAGQLDQRE